MRHQPFTIIIHIALAIMIVGAVVTHFSGIQGTMTISTYGKSTDRFEKTSGPGDGTLPFLVSLSRTSIDCYPATKTPMDYRTILIITETDEITENGGITSDSLNPGRVMNSQRCREISVSMNNVGEYRNWRFFQSGMSGDCTTLSISHDPWGTSITYIGYALLGIGMTGFFFQRNTPWRTLLRRYRKSFVTSLLLLSAIPSFAETLPTMQRPLADNLGRVMVYWNDRICPLQTMALDVTSVLYGGDSYEGLTAEQVMSGWLLHYDRWANDYFQNHSDFKELPPYPITKRDRKQAEKLALIEWLGTGEVWEGDMEQGENMQETLSEIRELLSQGKDSEANEAISLMITTQRQYGGEALPSETRINAELLYNKTVRPAYAAAIAFLLGLYLLIVKNPVRILPFIIGLTLLIYTAISMALSWYIGGHVPVSNGEETMMFMGFAAFLGALFCHYTPLRGSLLAIGAMALSVVVMGGHSPRIGQIAPVLSSPLLSWHVMLVMVSYTLFLAIALLSLIILLPGSSAEKHRLSMLSRLLLTPAVCLLGAGIFLGAVWANQTWGRYWGWDPKETCSLVMWLVYALPLHWGSRRLTIFRSEKPLAMYLLAAVATVIFTYFGANYLLTGLHSYA